jgi:MscS family membrane protein
MLEISYLNNTLETWILSFSIAAGAIISGKFIYWLIQKTLKRYTQKTDNDLDFIFVDMLEEPLTLAIAIFGLWWAIGILNINAAVLKFIDSVFYFLIVFNIAWFLTRLLSAVIEKYIVPKVKQSQTDLDDILLPIIRKIINITIWAMSIVVGIDNAGYDVTTMVTGLGIGGLVFALAAKDAVSNLFGGVIIFSDKPFNINERIILNGYEGYVREIGLRSIKLETLDGRVVTMPNSKVTDNPVLNISKEKGRRIKFHLGLTYDTDPKDMQKAKQILTDIIDTNEHTQDAVIAFDSFGDFSLNILVLYWIKKGSPIVKIQDEINMQILSQFNKNNLNFAFPTQSIIVEKQ